MDYSSPPGRGVAREASILRTIDLTRVNSEIHTNSLNLVLFLKFSKGI
jgi:hypothetical protein